MDNFYIGMDNFRGSNSTEFTQPIPSPLTNLVGFSCWQLNRKIKILSGKTTNQLIREFRLTQAKELLQQKAATVSEVAYQVGYSNLSYFSKSYKDAFEELPKETYLGE